MPDKKQPREVTRRDWLKLLGAQAAGILVIRCKVPAALAEKAGYDWTKHDWAYAMDIRKCIGCGACMRACQAENDVPEQCYRTWVERYRVDSAGNVSVDVATGDDHVFTPTTGDVEKALFVPKLCNQCTTSPCTQVCPVGASYTTKDGVILVDEEHCVGCGYCVQACPYGSRFLHPETGVADKCTLCYHRITKGLPPACAVACPTGTRIFGDLKDPQSRISRLLKRHRHRYLKPDLGTTPKVAYFGLDSEIV